MPALVLLFSGWLCGILAGKEGHIVALSSDGMMVCSRFGELRLHSVGEAAEGVQRHTPNIRVVWYFLLLAEAAVGGWEGERGLAPGHVFAFFVCDLGLQILQSQPSKSGPNLVYLVFTSALPKGQ